jgi:predicted Rossmann fold nucleotide-binding protein DprA/Smf involved in DNA uptake
MSWRGCATRWAGLRVRRDRRSAAVDAGAGPRPQRPTRPGLLGVPGRRRHPVARPRGQNKAKVLEALKGGPMTASEISKTTGIATGTVGSLLTKLATTGEVTKAERGYRLPD